MHIMYLSSDFTHSGYRTVCFALMVLPAEHACVGGGGGGVYIYDSDKGRYNIAGHEDDTEFEEAFWIKMLRSFCNVG